MNCNCIEELRTALKQAHGVGRIDFALKMSINLKEGGMKACLPPLSYTFNKIKDNGKPEAKQTRSYVMFMYCPFCGKQVGSKEIIKDSQPTTP